MPHNLFLHSSLVLKRLCGMITAPTTSSYTRVQSCREKFRAKTRSACEQRSTTIWQRSEQLSSQHFLSISLWWVCLRTLSSTISKLADEAIDALRKQKGTRGLVRLNIATMLSFQTSFARECPIAMRCPSNCKRHCGFVANVCITTGSFQRLV